MNPLDIVATTANGDTRHRLHHRVDGRLTSVPLAEVDAGARAVAAWLRDLGVRRGDRVGVLSRNRLEWVLLDLAVLKLGAVTAGFEPDRFDPARVVADFGLALLFTDSPVTGSAAGSTSAGPTVADPTSLDSTAAGPASTSPTAAGDRVRSIAEVADAARTGRDVPPGPGYGPADICAIKFTSGSTGSPKGLEVTAASVADSLAAVQDMFHHGDGDNLLVFLGNWFLQQRYWFYSALAHGHDVTLATVDDALDVAREARPTVVMGVPGFYEQLRSLVADVPETTRGQAIQDRMGGRIRYLWTGSAPAGRAVLEFFNGAGVPLYEGYGLNETCIVTKNHPGAFRLGSVGKPLPHKTIRFDPDGVLVVGSRFPVNTRYTWSAPGANEKMFLPTGEVRTQDIGYVDDDGFLYIQGRVDDVIALGTGYNVIAPVVEHRLREHRAVHDCVLHGSGRDRLVAVVSPAPGADLDALREFVARLNGTLLPEQRVHAVVVAAERFSIDNGLLTGQYKPRRGEIHQRHAAGIEAAHAGPPLAVVRAVNQEERV
ncbi:AMP-binding protein [Actinosynnema sp. CS-041913]|uniref:AMP-binding protein n=1 Tax=Actinosynnema sp. CS-041913 TaxID=3239917 RepID=UPI003D8FFC1C